MVRTLSVAAVVLTAGLVVAAELKSGPQPGEKVPGPFTPLNVTGDAAGKKNCLYCSNGDNPVAVVFARCADCPMTQKLIKELDKATVANEKADMGSYVVFCADEEKMEEKLKEFAKKEGLKKIVLSIDSPTGPGNYKINKDADVTVILYKDRKVVTNAAFKKGELTDAGIESIIKDVPKITK
jgi:hypothetical protein